MAASQCGSSSADQDQLELKISLLNKLKADTVRNMPTTYPFRFSVTGQGDAVACYGSYDFNEQVVLPDRSVADVSFGFKNLILERGGIEVVGLGEGKELDMFPPSSPCYVWGISLPVRVFPGMMRHSSFADPSKTISLAQVELHAEVLANPCGRRFVKSRANIENALALSIELGYRIAITLGKKSSGNWLQYWALDSCGKKRTLAFQLKC